MPDLYTWPPCIMVDNYSLSAARSLQYIIFAWNLMDSVIGDDMTQSVSLFQREDIVGATIILVLCVRVHATPTPCAYRAPDL